MNRAFVLASLAFSGCLEPAPDHCANRAGDATCRELDGGFCSRCTQENNGCVSEQPPASCWASMETPSEETSDSAADGGESSETGDLSECNGDLVTDASCPAETPICFDGACSSCVNAGSSMACASATPEQPICAEAVETCVACLPEEEGACTEGTVCGPDFECRACLEHSDCPVACDFSRSTCFQSIEEFWVDNIACDSGSGTSTATRDDPACTIGEAIEIANTQESSNVAVHLVGGEDRSLYDETIELTFSGPENLVLLGEARPLVRHIEARNQAKQLFVQGLDVEQDGAEQGVFCQGFAQIWLDDVSIRNSTDGFRASGCKQARLRRVQIVENSGSGVRSVDSNLHIESSVIARNGLAEEGSQTVGIQLEGDKVELLYSTVAANIGGRPSPDGEFSGTNLFCVEGTDISGRNNVIVSEPLGSIRCPSLELQTSFIDTNTTRLQEGGNVITDDYNSTWFAEVGASDFHIRFPETSPFRNVAVRAFGDPTRDLDGAIRVSEPGQTDFAGADQP